MILSKIYKNTLLILAACLVLTACATKKEVATDAIKVRCKVMFIQELTQLNI
jgi:outer membrane biogenesis lipoprotein LolB